jgi:STE24 endopeptidase
MADEPLGAAPESVDPAPTLDRSPAPALTAQQRAESREYGRRELTCTLVDMAIDVVYLGVMAVYGGGLIDRWLDQWSIMQIVWLRLAALFLIVMGIHYLLAFPLSVYSGFLLEHRFHMSRQSFTRWLRRYLLQQVLVIGFGLVMVIGLFAIIWWAKHWWWLVAAVATFVVTALLGQLLPVLILPLFYKIKRLEDEDLKARFELLTRGTSLRVEGVYRMQLSSETVKANALLAGWGRTRRVILGDTLLDQFRPEEIGVVLAHEIGHHVYHHIPKLILLGLVTTTAGFLLCDWILVHWVTAVTGTFDYAQVPVHALPMLMFVMTVFSLLSSPLRNGVSRRFEIACDRYALRTTADPDAFRSAFTKLAWINKADPDPPWLEVVLLHDHPSISQRLELASETRI